MYDSNAVVDSQGSKLVFVWNILSVMVDSFNSNVDV